MSLRFPLVFWNEQEPPALSFTACIITRDATRVVTGTNGGICVLWKLNDNNNDDYNNNSNDDGDDDDDDDEQQNGKKLEPFAVLYGHESTVTDMCECYFDHVPAVCSVSVDGTLCVWNLNDGRCMAVLPYLLQGAPTSIVSLSYHHHHHHPQVLESSHLVSHHKHDSDGFVMEDETDEINGLSKYANLVACAGKYNTIEIVDLRQLRVVRVLEGHTEWVRSLSCRMMVPDHPFESDDFRVSMLSVGDDSTMRYWSLNLLSYGNKSVSTDAGSSLGGLEGSMVPVDKKEKKKKKEKKDKDKEKKEKKKKESTAEAKSTTAATTSGTSSLLSASISSLSNSGAIPLGDIHCFAVNAHTDRPNSVSQSLDLSYIVVVSESKWMVFANHAFQPSFVVDAPEAGKKLQSGFFLDNRHVLISVIEGDAYVYRLPDLSASSELSVIEVSESDITNNDVKDSSPTDGESDSSQIDRVNPLSIGNAVMNAMSSHISEGPSRKKNTLNVVPAGQAQPELIHVLHVSKEGKGALSSAVWSTEADLIVRADTNGMIKMWRVDTSTNNGKFVAVEVDTTTLASGWWTRSTKGQNNHKTITATHFSVEKDQIPLLVHGYVDGKICVYPSVPSNVSDTNQQQCRPIVIQAHESRVTTLLVIYDEENARQLLISGSSDFTVKMWNLDLTMAGVEDVGMETCRRLLMTFYYHSGTVNLIFLPPKSIRMKFQNSFCSVAEDRSVIMYSAKTMECLHVFGGHPCSVVSVYFRRDLDYLLVRCSDSSVYVWQLSTGLMERKISGRSAMELIERSEGPGSVRRRDVKITFSKQSAMSQERSSGFLESISLGVEPHWDYSSRASNRQHRHHFESPDLQVLILSVRRLIGYMNSRTAMLKEFFARRKSTSPSLQHHSMNNGSSHGSSPSSSSSVSVRSTTTTSSREVPPSSLPYSLICSIAYTLQHGDEERCASLGNLRRFLQIDKGCMRHMPRAYIGLKGVGNTFSLIAPKASQRSHPFLFSPILSALHSISVVSILNCLSNIPELKSDCQKSIRYYLYEMPNDFQEYENPSFLWCARFLKDVSKEIQSAANQVMTASLSRMNPQEQNELAEKLVNLLLSSTKDRLRQNAVIALAVLVQKAPNSVDQRITSVAAHGLLEIVEKGGMQRNTAISLLGEGYSIWRHFLPDEMGFYRSLFHLSLPALISTGGSVDTATTAAVAAFEEENEEEEEVDDSKTETNLAIDALQAFVNVTNVAPFIYIEFINTMSSNTQQVPPLTLAAIVTSLYPIMKKYPTCLVPFVVPITALLLKVLDPHFPAIRDACLQTSTLVLRYMVEIYPMVCFHQGKQRLAIGGPDGMVVIYDMRTASKWQLFEAHHKKAIAAVAFSPSGELLATYSPKEYKCKVWPFDGSGVFTLLGMFNRSLKTFEVPTSRANITEEEILRGVRIEWNGAKQFALTPGKDLMRVSFTC